MKTLREKKGLFAGIVLFLVLVGILVWPAIPPVNIAVSQAQEEDEWIEVPLKVNVLKGVDIANDTIDGVVNETNAILKQAKVKLVFNKSRDININVSDTGNDDGKVSPDEKRRRNPPGLDMNGLMSLFHHFDYPKFAGYKVYISNEIFPGPNINGKSTHEEVITGDKTPVPVSYVKNRTTTTGPGGMGATLAHEFVHSMTVSAHDLTDKSNLMYVPANKRTNTTLTDAQKTEVRKGAKQVGFTKKKGSVISVNTLREYWVDDSGEVNQDYIDLFLGSLFSEGPTADLKITIGLSGLYPNGTDVNTKFEMGFDTDNNNSTGYYGVDKVLQITLQGKYPFTPPNGSISADLYDIASGISNPLTPGEVARMQEIVDVEDLPIPEASDYYDSIKQSLPLSLLGPLADVVPINLWATNLETGEYDWTSFQFDFNPPPGAAIEMEPLEAKPGQIVTVQGTRFPPLSTVTLLIDDTEILQTTTLTDGTFVMSFTVPDLTPDWYFVTAMSSNPFAFDFSVLNVVIPVGERDLPADALNVDAEYPGDTFDVYVNFTAPADDFAGIGLTDLAPAGWDVETDVSWCDPEASWTMSPGNKVEYAWSGPFSAGQNFTARYKVTIPATASPGINEWPNCEIDKAWLEYYVGAEGPFKSCVTGEFEKIVTVPGCVVGETRDVNADLLTTTLVVLSEQPLEISDEPEDSDSSTAPDALYEDDADDTGLYWQQASKYCYFPLDTNAMPGTRNPWHDDYINFTDTTLLAAGYNLDFEGDYGLVPKACSMGYAMESVNHWLFVPTDALAVPHPEWQLSNWKAMESVHSWQFPCGCNA